MTIDVWPDLDWSKAIRTPRTVLLEQSEILSVKSKGALNLVVTTGSKPSKQRFTDGCFDYRVSIYSLPLSYSLDFATVEHSLQNPYPAIIIEAGDGAERLAENEEQFVTLLKEILSKPKWIQSIDRLITMGNSQ